MLERTGEVADVFINSFKNVEAEYITNTRYMSVATHIMNCRTSQMGAFVYECEDCKHKFISYCSCRDRMCPKCQGQAHHEWIEKMEKVVIDCIHLHVVVTVPACLNRIALANKEVFYSALFEVASSEVISLCRNGKRLRATPGITAILHTWGQQLTFHPHIHLAVTAGGLTDDGRWLDVKRTKAGNIYLFPIKLLASNVKKAFLEKLRKLKKKGLLNFDDKEFDSLTQEAKDKDWISYCKEPFKGSKGVFAYIGNYTHRSAISNSRILRVTNNDVTFLYRDYADHNKEKLLTLTNEEFIRRFLMHVLAKGFVRIRHYGLYSIPNRKKKLATAKVMMVECRKEKQFVRKEEKKPEEAPLIYKCPCCGGVMYRTSNIPLTKRDIALFIYSSFKLSLPP